MNTKVGISALLLSIFAAGNTATVYECRFDGPFYAAGHKRQDQIQRGCSNNYEWGKKDIRIYASPRDNVNGTAQCFEIKGISSGALQFFVTGFAMKRGSWYRVSFEARGEGMEGQVQAQVRKISKPWTTYLDKLCFTPGEKWQRYELTGKAPTDVDNDFGLMIQTGAVGRLWLDNVKIEEFAEAPDNIKINRNPLIKGNIIPRSSAEGQRDYFWTSGIYAGPEGEWEDPQNYRVEPGKFGKYCLAIPSPTTEGTSFCRSFWLPVAAGSPYTFSVYLKGSRPHSVINMQIISRQGNRNLISRKIDVTDAWQRYSVTTPPVPAEITDVYLGFTTNAGNGTFHADGFQFEAGKAPTAYEPGYPFELYAMLDNTSANLTTWDRQLQLKLFAASATDSQLSGKLKVKLQLTAFPNTNIVEQELELPVNREYPLTIDTNRNGLFRLRLTALDEKTAAPQEIILAKLPQPRQTGRESNFGTHITVRPFFIDYARRIGMKWTRIHDASGITKWNRTEPQPEQYKFFDRQVDAILAAGLNILGLPDYPPQWAKTSGAKTGNVINIPAYRELCRRLAEHYKGRIDYWEVWNEPYMKYFFAGSPKQYADVLVTGAAAFRAGNPNAKILGFCTEINDLNFAGQIPPAARAVIDILSFHCYFQNLTGGGTTGYNQEIKAYLDFLKPVKPQEIWNTEGANIELGGNSFYSFLPASPELNDQAAAFASRVWIEQKKAGIDKLFIYTLHQSDTVMYYGGYKKLIGFDRSITPAAVSCAVAAWCIDGLPSLPLPRQTGTVQGLFGNGKRAAWAVFDDSAVPGKSILNLDKIPNEVRLLDVMGNNPRLDGTKWEIGIKPLFAVTEQYSPEELARCCRAAISPR